jgi:hypothetical protein
MCNHTKPDLDVVIPFDEGTTSSSRKRLEWTDSAALRVYLQPGSSCCPSPRDGSPETLRAAGFVALNVAAGLPNRQIVQWLAREGQAPMFSPFLRLMSGFHCPDVLAISQAHEWLPLHIAAQYSSLQIVQCS